jgi:hypothetical protein
MTARPGGGDPAVYSLGYRPDERPAAREEEGPPSAAETLREAARLVRERARSVEHFTSPWETIPPGPGDSDEYVVAYAGHTANSGCVAVTPDYGRFYLADHIASWHPAVALAVADWLDEVAGTTQYAWDIDRVRLEQHSESVQRALATARVYLGGHR